MSVLRVLSVLLLALSVSTLSGVAGQFVCPQGSTYTECGSACPATCSEPIPAVCIELCVEQCACDPGLVLVGGPVHDPVCVPASECPNVAQCDIENFEQCGPVPVCAVQDCGNGDFAGCDVQCVPKRSDVSECEIKVYSEECPNVDCNADDACGPEPALPCEPFFCPGESTPIQTCFWSCGEQDGQCQWLLAEAGIFCPPSRSNSSPASALGVFALVPLAGIFAVVCAAFTLA